MLSMVGMCSAQGSSAVGRNFFAVASADVCVVLTHYVQDYRVVGRVAIMFVPMPVGGPDVYFDVSHPKAVADAYLGIEEVGTRVGVQ